MLLLLFLLLIFFFPLHASATTEFIFNGFTASNLSLNGLAEVTSDGLLLLTNNTKEALGHAFYPSPINFSASVPSSFSTTFVFAIVPQYPDVGGHGLAFAISPHNDLPGSMPSQHLGLFNDSDNGNFSNHLIAVELDTVKTVEYHDIDNNHVGIDVNNMTSLNSSTAGYYESTTTGTFTKLNLMSGNAMQVWINYDAGNARLDVTIAPLKMPKPTAPLVSSTVNLSDIVLNNMFVGFSASTGAGSSDHYVLGWSFSMGGEAQDLDLSRLPSIPQKANPKKGSSAVGPVAWAVSGFSLLLIVVLGVFFYNKRRKKFQEVKEDWELEYGPHRIRYVDIYKATKGFDEENLVGTGGFGKVYKGIMPKSRVEVAVKRISHNSRQGIREFVSEIASMSRLRHRNLVQLLGYCRRQGELILVYDFMSNGSLDSCLFEGKEPLLNWDQRFKIIKDVAAGLLYLHEGWEQLVIHRDIKASNVLLDSSLNGKLSDFGLARLYDHGTNPTTTHIVGTLGYLAPEISRTGKATTSSDVFAFGAFLLEVVCGRRPMEFSAGLDDALGLVELVAQQWRKGNIIEVVDPNMKGFDEEEVILVLKLGLLCSHPEPTSRPRMRQVVQFLEGSAPIPDLLVASLGDSIRFASYDVSFDDFIASYSSTAELNSGHQSSAYTDTC